MRNVAVACCLLLVLSAGAKAQNPGGNAKVNPHHKGIVVHYRQRPAAGVAGKQMGDGSVHFTPKPNRAIDRGENVGPDITYQKMGRNRRIAPGAVGKIGPGNIRHGHPKGTAGTGPGGTAAGKVSVGLLNIDPPGYRVKGKPYPTRGPTVGRIPRPRRLRADSTK